MILTQLILGVYRLILKKEGPWNLVVNYILIYDIYFFLCKSSNPIQL